MWATRTSLLRAVRTGGTGQLVPGVALVHVRVLPTNLGRAVRTVYAYRGNPGESRSPS